jgi:PAS domain S-box-containing protein
VTLITLLAAARVQHARLWTDQQRSFIAITAYIWCAMEYRSRLRLLRQISQSVHWNNSSHSWLRCALLMSALLLLAAPSFCANPPRLVKVLILFYGDKDSPALAGFQTGLRTGMEQEVNAPVWISVESFDEGWRGHSPLYERSLEKFLRDKYGKRGIDIVVPFGDYPLQYMQERRKTLLPDAKLIYILLGHSPQQTIPEATGQVWKFDLAPTLEVALIQNPGTRHLLLITGASALDRALAQVFLANALKYLHGRSNKVDVQVLVPGTFDETRAALAALPQDTITVFVAYYGDSGGQGFVPARVLPALSAITNRPIYGAVDSYLGHGIVGGSLVNAEATGAEFGTLVLRVLRGEKPGNIPEVSSDLRQYAFDWQQMKRWGIGIDKVPAGSRVINREYTFWELHKWRIIGLLVLIVAELALTIDLLRLTIAQKRSLKQLKCRHDLEAVIAQLAAGFVNLPAELLKAGIEKEFQQLLEFFDVDRIGLFEFSAATAQLRLLYSRAATGVDQPPPVVDLHQLPWTASHILEGTPIVASHLGQLPEDASGLREFLRTRGVRSFIAFPLRRNENTFATLSFSTVRNEREWKPELVQALRTIANIFGTALERKYAEEAVRESEGRFRLVANTAPVLIWMSGPDKLCTYFNQPWLDFTGRPLEAQLGNGWAEGVHPDDFEKCLETYTQAFDRREPFRMEYRLRVHDGKFRWILDIGVPRVSADGSFAGYIGSCVDVNERKRTEQALHQSEQLKASILGSLRNQVIVLDSKGIVVASNKHGFDFATRPYPRDEKEPEGPADKSSDSHDIHQGTDYLEIWRIGRPADDPSTAVAMSGIRAVCDGERGYFELEYSSDSDSGTDQRWFLMSVTPLKGLAPGAVVSHQDVTEQKRHEQAIQELSGRLIGAQEQERSRIARDLHDDVNQQLAVLAIELQQLEAFFPEDSSEGRQKAHTLWKKTCSLSAEVQQLSHQLHSTKLEHLGIIAALRGLCAEFSEQYKIEADFHFRQVPSGLGSDISLSLFRVAQESLRNVAKHSRAKNARVELTGGGERVLLRVSDDGVGFDQSQTKQQTGLGLISMSERIRLVNGTLSVRSAPSRGTQVEAAVPFSSKTVAMKGTSLSASTKAKSG